MNLKEALKDDLTEEELKLLKTAHDTVGTIVILDIPDELVKKEKLIALALLKTRSNIKTVLKKSGIHHGEFRTQNMVFLAGEDTRETMHSESSTRLMLDVESVYFSPRLSTERERVAKQIKDGEDILVMFSGCAPYPCVIAKNAKPHFIVGIEKNPMAHIYGEMNTKLNKLKNVELINGDVKDIIPEIYHHLIGLKSSDNKAEIKKRLNHHPRIMELHLFPEDLFEKREELENTIQELQKKHIEVFMHMPFNYNGHPFNMSRENIDDELKVLDVLGRICKQYMIKAVVHPVHCNKDSMKIDEELVIKNMKRVRRYYDYFMFENIILGNTFNKVESVIRIAEKAGARNLCVDIAHLYCVYKDTDKMVKAIKKIQAKFNTYFHVSDSNGSMDAMELGKGKIDFNKILPLVNKGVAEVRSKDEFHPIEMLRSYDKIDDLQRRFDRILMPLPKSAEEFLDDALKAVKKGTIIHFYDFLHESSFSDAHDKIARACKKNEIKYKILDTVKCGQHAPYIFRICVDVEIF